MRHEVALISVQFEYAVQLARRLKGYESRVARTGQMLEKYAQISARLRIVLVHVSGQRGQSCLAQVPVSTTQDLGTRSCLVVTGHVCFLLVLGVCETQTAVLNREGKTLEELACRDVACLFRVVNVVPLRRPYATRGTESLGSSPVALCDFQPARAPVSPLQAEEKLEHHGEMSADVLMRASGFTHPLNCTVVGRRALL